MTARRRLRTAPLALLLVGQLAAQLALPAFADVVPAAPEVLEAAPPVDAPDAPDAAPVPTPDLSEPVATDDPTGVASALDDLIWPFIKTMLMLCLVLALVYLSLNKGLGKLMKRTQAGKRMKVVERVTLDQKRAIFLVEVDGEEILLAAGEGGVTRLDRDKASAPDRPFDLAEAKPGKPPPVTGVRATGERVRLPDEGSSDADDPEEPAA